MIEKAREKHLGSVMAIWLNTNIAAHSFIPQSYWESLLEQVKEAMLASDVFVYHENDQVLGFIGITGNEYIAGLFVKTITRPPSQKQRAGFSKRSVRFIA